MLRGGMLLIPRLPSQVAVMLQIILPILRKLHTAPFPSPPQTRLRMSAPVALGHRRLSSSKRTPRSTDMPRVWMPKMAVRPFRSGSSNSGGPG